MENKKEMENKKIQKSTKVKLQKNFYSPRRGENQYQILSSQKKIENEIGSMTIENRNNFREALNKYSFDSEVFIPKTISINKNEYNNKNYLLNNLVTFESKSLERKKLVEPLRKETKRFSKQYQLIRTENEEHQKEYLRGLENYYHDIGYNINNIEYKNAENIFNPSFLLDNNFGMDIQEDAYKYSNMDLKKDYNIDNKLLKKWQKGVQETKENKIRAKSFAEEDEMKGVEDEETKEKEKEKEYKKVLLQKELEKIKKNLMEENRIRNMSRKEYFYYNMQIKNDIKTTKKLLEEFDENKNNSFFKSNRLSINSIDNNRISKTYKIVHPSQPKNYKEKIVFSSLDLSKDNQDKKIKKERNKKVVKNYLSSKFQIRKSLNDNSPVAITENNVFISSDKINDGKRDSLPKLPMMMETKEGYNNKDFTITENNKIPKEEIISEMLIKKRKQSSELDKLYNLVYNNKKNFFEKYPYKSVESYFKKYTNKRIPVVNYRKGSNIHGLLEDLQQIVKKKDFYKIAESSNDVKKEYINKRGLSYNKLIDDNNFDVNKIQEMDDRIPELHYIYAEDLLTNKARENTKK